MLHVSPLWHGTTTTIDRQTTTNNSRSDYMSKQPYWYKFWKT